MTSHLNFYENYHIDHYSLLGGTAQPDVERATDRLLAPQTGLEWHRLPLCGAAGRKRRAGAARGEGGGALPEPQQA